MAVVLDRKKVLPNQIQTLAEEAFKWGQETYRLHMTASKPDIQTVLQSWVSSVPYDVYNLPKGKYVAKLTGPFMLGSIRPTLGLSDTEPKAYWKQFSSKKVFYEHLVHEASRPVLRNKVTEQGLANQVLAHDRTAAVLNDLRRAIGKYFWDHDSYSGWASYYLMTNPLANLIPNISGSYNEANSYPSHERSEPWQYIDGVSDADGQYNAVAFVMNWVAQPLFDYSLRSKDRQSLSFDTRDFTVAENIAILHDLKELFSPWHNSRALWTWHKIQVPHPYQGANSPDVPQRWADKTDRGCDGEHVRVEILIKDLTLTRARTKQARIAAKEIKWDQGRNGAGTRNEDSPDTKTARSHHMPIETGRSHTAARLFEMVSLLKPGPTASKSDKDLFAARLQAIAFGIFGYWNADYARGGYPKSLTPIHTYHEVMDPAEDYLEGIYSEPFTYENVKKYLKTV